MSERFDDLSYLPGQRPVRWRKESWRRVAAAVAGACWPPLILTLPLFPPIHWGFTGAFDWRFIVLAVGLVATPGGLWLLHREREATGKPSSRLGIVWRFILYGGLFAAALQTLHVVVMSVLNSIGSVGVGEVLGAVETTVLIYGVGGLPLAMVVGVSYALWAGLCAAFIAFEHAPKVKDRLGVIGSAAPAEPRRRF